MNVKLLGKFAVVLMLCLVVFTFVGSSLTTLVCPVTPTGEGEGEEAAQEESPAEEAPVEEEAPGLE